MLDFSPSFFRNIFRRTVVVLCVLGRNFRHAGFENRIERFLDPYHVSKLKFSSKFLENWPLHHELDLPRFLNISIMIEQSFLRKVIKRSRFGRF